MLGTLGDAILFQAIFECCTTRLIQRSLNMVDYFHILLCSAHQMNSNLKKTTREVLIMFEYKMQGEEKLNN